MSELGARSVQGFLGALSVFDVGVHPVPLDDGAGFIVQRVCAEEKPPILAVVPA